MSDINSIREFFEDNEVDYLSVLSEPLYQKIGGVINFLVDSLNSSFKLGDFLYSGLTQGQMDLITGTGTWVKPQGQSIAGSDYAILSGVTTLPDSRGCFLRGFDDGRGVDPGRTLASYQAPSIKPHSHVICSATDNIGSSFNELTTKYINNVRADSGTLQGFGGDVGATRDVGDVGISDATPKNNAVYLYVKVNN